ncbi:hypothetical protein OG897_06165 [Streptomyces sp. NBC_00237]|uniref:hypothetical protein n=1 Tax=Streptomyces sp. NBC_00237 TaxID=2975687 RepID=UPI00224DCC44|nr:hypothetical protein [Streptomyces sp. NBC_00237]MCX5201046.1 hypothetical protein [Streptomyces sp. NBC_00237]
MATSAVPGAITALLGILRAAPALAEVEVLDGPPVGDMADADLVVVGWAPGADTAAELVQDFAYAGARRRDEELSISCWVESWSGDLEIGPRRERAFALLAVVEDAIRASGGAPEAPTLGGTVLWSHLTRAALQQFTTDQGVRAGIAFTVSCRARI